MHVSLVMTMIGPDRPGLVDLVAGVVADHGGNWLESRMSHLGGHFAGILRIQAPADREAELAEALRGLTVQGLSVVVHHDRTGAAVPPPITAHLEILGQDRPGIVRQISRALADFGVNVEELQTECVSAPMSGEALFKAEAKLHLPPEREASDLRAALERVAADLLVDISFAEVKAVRHRVARLSGGVAAPRSGR
jgi:glycine cleavage system regulatory protein